MVAPVRFASARSLALCLYMGLVLPILGGCVKVGPDYLRPEISVYRDWHTQLNAGPTPGETDAQSLAVWWTALNDPKLSGLIERAVAGNLDLKQAQARVREARARRGIAASDLFPTLDGSGAATWSRTITDAGPDTSGDLYTVGLDAGWELDIFGGVRRSVEAAEGDLQASRENLRNVLVSLLAEVALNYLDVRIYQDRIAVALDNLQSQSATYQLTQWRYEAGLSDELAVQQARYNLENTRSQLPLLRTGLDAAMNRVAVLLGEQPGMVHAELQQPGPIPVPPLEIAAGIPADLLRRRPDVRQAERELAAQTARIGVATADLYPRFTLSGSIGLEFLSLNNPSSTVTLLGGPRVTWAIFKGGAILQNIELQSALQEQALIQFETAILSALEEVENALVAYTEVQQRRQALSAATEAARIAAKLAEHKYHSGLTDFTNVLDAQRSLLSFQEQLALSNGNVTGNLVRLYKALGGGWNSHATDRRFSGEP